MEEQITTTKAEPKERKAPVPVKALIGVWDEDLVSKTNTFIVKATTTGDAKAIRDAVKALGFGEYEVIVGRTHPISYQEVKKTSLSIG
ncbi:MAG: hypothetical protein WC107_07480 [Patescibacteria group bacterium]